MASIFRRKGRDLWYYSYFDETGKRHTCAGGFTKEQTRRMAEKVEAELLYRKRGLIDQRQERYIESERLPLAEHVEAFEHHLYGRGGGEKHVKRTIACINEINAACGFATAGGIDAGRLSEFLAKERKAGRSPRTVNEKLIAVRSFTRWLFESDRTRTDVLKGLKRDTKGERSDQRRKRRALSDKEIAALLRATEQGPDVEGMCGPERAVVYALALGTGLRAGEIRSLTVRDFDLADLDKASVTIQAAYSKNRRTDTLPLRRDLAERLAGFIKQAMKHPGARLFNLPDRTAELLAGDLVRAKVHQEDGAGRVCDFHALRHSFITRLARSGVSPAVAKRLARHSTITLTVDRYTHVGLADERAAVDQLPALDLEAIAETVRATGTDDTCAKNGMQSGQRASGSIGPDGSTSDHQSKGEVLEERESEERDITPPKGQCDAFCENVSSSDTDEKANGPGWTRTNDQPIMSRLL